MSQKSAHAWSSACCLFSYEPAEKQIALQKIGPCMNLESSLYSALEKLSCDFTPLELRDRIDMLARNFSTVVTILINQKKEDCFCFRYWHYPFPRAAAEKCSRNFRLPRLAIRKNLSGTGTFPEHVLGISGCGVSGCASLTRTCSRIRV